MKKYLNIIIPLVIAAVFLVINLMLWNGFFFRKKAIGREMESVEKQISLAGRIEEIDREFTAVTEPFFDDFFSLKDFINRTAEIYGVMLYSIKPAGRFGEKEKFPEIDINLSLKSEYNKFLEFISTLEDNPAVGVKIMDLKADPEEESLVSVLMVITGTGK